MSFKERLSNILYPPNPPIDTTAYEGESESEFKSRYHLPKDKSRGIKGWFLATRVDATGKRAGQTRIDWGNTILAFLVIIGIILIAIFCIQPGAETSGWYGTHQTP